MVRSESSSAAAPLRVGGYSLDVGPGSGSFARFEPTEERENARQLRAALAQDEKDPPAPVAAIEEFQETADAVTGRIEQAEKLLTAAADRKLLTPGNLNSEIDALLDLFGRLDRAGRFEEALKLMRSLNGLLALTLRWLDLIRSLRSLLRSATDRGHHAGQAFAHHELGSLHLCAGRSKDASEHLAKALRIEKQLGDLASQCATRHNLDSAQRDALASRAWRRSRRQLLASILVAAAFVLLGGGGGTGLALAIRGGGGGGGGTKAGGDHSPATLTVHEDFEPKAKAASVTLAVRCTNGGRPDRSSKTATEGTPAVFSIAGLGKGATCTATQAAGPTGYRTLERGCRDVPIAGGTLASCMIVNTSTGGGSSGNKHPATASATLTVGADNPGRVKIAVTCDGGAVVTGTPAYASRDAPASFSVRGFVRGATCAASEETPSGYTTDESGCLRVPIADGRSSSCSIVDTLNTTTLTVRVDFTSASTSNPVEIGLSCPSGVGVDPTSQAVSLGAPAPFKITRFASDTTCSVTGGKLAGYESPDLSDCLTVPVATKGECTIVYSPVG